MGRAGMMSTQNTMSQIQQLAQDEIEAKDGASVNGAIASIHQYAFQNNLSVFTLSGVSRLRHDGLMISTPYDTSQGPAFEVETYSLTAGARWDGSETLGLAPKTMIFGGFGNYAFSDVTIGDDSKPALADGSIRTYSVGGYGLLNRKPFYLLGIASYSWGATDIITASRRVQYDPDSTGFYLSANAGALLPMTGGLSLDLRVGVSFGSGEVGDYSDNTGYFYETSVMEETVGSVSAKIFSQHQWDNTTLRPFAQAGLSHRLDSENEITINGTPFAYDDADVSVFGRVGVDIDYKGFQSYVAVKGERSSDREAISGQVGITWKFD